jgi:hypothetical protein
MLLGAAAYSDGAPNSNCTAYHPCGGVDTFFDGVSDDLDHGMRTVGTGLLVTGAVLVVAGLVANAQHSEVDTTPVATTNERVTVGVTFAPPGLVVGPGGVLTPDVTESSATPAELALRSKIENRLAIQASSSARRGDCVASAATTTHLAQVDATMHAELLRTDRNVVDCLAVAAAARR